MKITNTNKATLAGGKKPQVKSGKKKLSNQGLVAPAKFGAVPDSKKAGKKKKSSKGKNIKRIGTVRKEKLVNIGANAQA